MSFKPIETPDSADRKDVKQKDSLNDYERDLECPICYQLCVHPTKLPCGHVFCYLCAKGAVARSRKCAMCRTVIDWNYLDQPELLDKSHLGVKEDSAEVYQWFYQARRSGWWVYEKRTALELEERYQKNPEDVFELQIAGFVYTIDFKNMEQYRKDDRATKRAMKRDKVNNVDIVGQAGLRLQNHNSPSHNVQQRQHGEGETTRDNLARPQASMYVHVHPSRPEIDISQLMNELSMNAGRVSDSSGSDEDSEIEPESIV